MYYESYKREDFSADLISAIESIGTKCNIGHAYEIISTIKRLYEIQADFTIEYKPEKNVFNGGMYIDIVKKFVFYKHISLINILHEARHYIQMNTSIVDTLKDSYNAKEEDARKWSCSLLYICFPDYYMRLAKEGKLLYV